LQIFLRTGSNYGYVVKETARDVTPIKRDVSPPVYHMLFPHRTPLITVVK